MAAQELIAELPSGFVEEFRKDILGTLPEEKIQAGIRQARNARVMQQAGSVHIPGVGQKIAEIDARLYFRMKHAFGQEENWLDDFLADNPELCAPGYRPKSRSLRHSRSFIGGVPA